MNPELESALWYTGSTIAQTLSGAMGLLGAIMLFSLQEASRSVQRAAEELSAMPHATLNPHFIHHLLARRSFRELARAYSDQIQGAQGGETSVELLAHHSTLTWELEHVRSLRRSFWSALVASGVVIVAAIAGTGFAPELARRPGIGKLILLLLMAGAGGCLVLYGILLRVMFRVSREEAEGPA